MATYLIVGNGVAGNAAAESIRKSDPSGRILIFTKEKYPFYYTPALPEFLAGEKQIQDFTIHPPQWYERNRIDLYLECPVTKIDPVQRVLYTSRTEAIGYDRLLLACGGNSFIPPIPGANHERVLTLRWIDDALKIRDLAKTARKVIVIGGGLLGLEAGNGLRKLGLEVTVVEFAPRLLPRQMDIPGASILQKQMEGMGFRFFLGVKTQEILPHPGGMQIRLDSGEMLEADFVLVSAGVRPELTLTHSLHLTVDKGVKVDDFLQTEIEGIYAAGDLIEHRGRFYGIWPAAMEQGRIAGINMAGGKEKYSGTVPSNQLKVVGIDLVSMGEIDEHRQWESIVVEQESKGYYRKLVLKENRIIGAILLGDIRGNDAIQRAIQSQKDIGPFKSRLADESFDFSQLS